jgi:hypothetical protein
VLDFIKSNAWNDKYTKSISITTKSSTRLITWSIENCKLKFLSPSASKLITIILIIIIIIITAIAIIAIIVIVIIALIIALVIALIINIIIITIVIIAIIIIINLASSIIVTHLRIIESLELAIRGTRTIVIIKLRRFYR